MFKTASSNGVDELDERDDELKVGGREILSSTIRTSLSSSNLLPIPKTPEAQGRSVGGKVTLYANGARSFTEI